MAGGAGGSCSAAPLRSAKTVALQATWDEQAGRCLPAVLPTNSAEPIPTSRCAPRWRSYASYFDTLRTDVAGGGADDIFWINNLPLLPEYADNVGALMQISLPADQSRRWSASSPATAGCGRAAADRTPARQLQRRPAGRRRTTPPNYIRLARWDPDLPGIPCPATGAADRRRHGADGQYPVSTRVSGSGSGATPPTICRASTSTS